MKTFPEALTDLIVLMLDSHGLTADEMINNQAVLEECDDVFIEHFETLRSEQLIEQGTFDVATHLDNLNEVIPHIRLLLAFSDVCDNADAVEDGDHANAYDTLCDAISDGVGLVLESKLDATQHEVFITSVNIEELWVTHTIDDIEQPLTIITADLLSQAVELLVAEEYTDPADCIEMYTDKLADDRREPITKEAVQSIIDYIDDGNPDLTVIKAELGELILRSTGEYFD